MLYINAKERVSIDIFRSVMYTYIKENKLRYSDQRERVLKILYTQQYPISIELLVKKLNERTLGASYATVSRHIKFFQKIEMLIVVKKVQSGYLLKKSIEEDGAVEVLSHDINYKDDS